MNDELYSLDEDLDDNAFLASLDALLTEPQEAAPQEAAPELPPKPPKRKPKWLLGALCGLAACALLGAGVYGFLTLRDPYHRKILPGVTVGTVELSGMTEGQAKKALAAAYPLSREPMAVSFREEGTLLQKAGIAMDTRVLVIPAERAGARVDVSAAAKKAYLVGREEAQEENAIPLADFVTVNEDAIRETVRTFCQSQQELLLPHTAYLEGSAPDVEDPNAQPQTLVITESQSGVRIQEDVLYETVMSAYREGRLSCTYQGPIDPIDPGLPDLQKLYDEACFPAREPSIDKQTLAVTPGRRGYQFDVEDALQQVQEAGNGVSVRIPLSFTAPTISDEDVYFLDVLGHCETPHGTNEKRNTNLRIACAALDGLVLQPGEEFSYNEALGERTADKGYQPAPAYSGTTLVDSLGGGICQVSSTVYLASVYAELTILERVNHGYPVSYIPLGMDATVNWGFTDLKMRNDSPLPVKIHAEESDGYVRVDILGTETRDYDIQMTYSVGGRHVKTFKTKIDKATGQALGPREQVALSAYLEDIYK